MERDWRGGWSREGGALRPWDRAPWDRRPWDPGTMGPGDPGTRGPWDPGTMGPGTMGPWDHGTGDHGTGDHGTRGPWDPGGCEALGRVGATETMLLPANVLNPAAQPNPAWLCVQTDSTR